MKTVLYTVAFFCLTANLKAQTTKPEHVAAGTEKKHEVKEALAFKSKQIDKGDIKFGAEEVFEFEFKNSTKEMVVIDRVQPGCGCTHAQDHSKDPISPGGKSSLKFTYDTKRVGDFAKTITVYTSIGEPIILTIKGKVLPNPNPEPTSAH